MHQFVQIKQLLYKEWFGTLSIWSRIPNDYQSTIFVNLILSTGWLPIYYLKTDRIKFSWFLFYFCISFTQLEESCYCLLKLNLFAFKPQRNALTMSKYILRYTLENLMRFFQTFQLCGRLTYFLQFEMHLC